MKINQPMVAFVVLLIVHSFVSVAAYRLLTTRTRTALSFDTTPVDTTTTAQLARGERSFQIATGGEQITRTVPWVVPLYVLFGYAALALALVLALIDRFRSPTI
jgi:hypothetical protein